MVDYLHGSESETLSLPVLHQPQTPRILLFVLQGWAACKVDELAGKSDSSRV
jgi:hypothetical protein